MTTQRILLVDDEAALLDGLCRNHRKRYELVAACGPLAGLKAVANDGPFAAVVTDFQMPGMNGIEFLKEARELRPDMIPVMLTGQADLRVAADAVNRGQIFRFLTKPATAEDFRMCLDAAIDQFRLRNAERVLLEETVRGSIEVMAEILALCNPLAFGRAARIKGLVRSITRRLGLSDGWRYETAAMLSQIGCVSIPSDVIERSVAGEELAEHQLSMFEGHPALAKDLLSKIPRLSEVADIVAAQRPTTAPSPSDSVAVRGGRILAIALEFDELLAVGAKPNAAVRALRERTDLYPLEVVNALAAAAKDMFAPAVAPIRLELLRVGMVLDQDVRSSSGVLIVARGHELTMSSLVRVRNFARLGHLQDTSIVVRVRPLNVQQRAAVA